MHEHLKEQREGLSSSRSVRGQRESMVPASPRSVKGNRDSLNSPRTPNQKSLHTPGSKLTPSPNSSITQISTPQGQGQGQGQIQGQASSPSPRRKISQNALKQPSQSALQPGGATTHASSTSSSSLKPGNVTEVGRPMLTHFLHYFVTVKTFFLSLTIFFYNGLCISRKCIIYHNVPHCCLFCYNLFC